MRLEAKRIPIFQAFDPAVLRLAAITLQHIANPHVQRKVQQGTGTENRIRPVDHVEVPRDATGDHLYQNNNHPETLRKVFADKQLFARTDRASHNIAGLDRIRLQAMLRLAMAAAHHDRINIDLGLRGPFTVVAVKR